MDDAGLRWERRFKKKDERPENAEFFVSSPISLLTCGIAANAIRLAAGHSIQLACFIFGAKKL